MFWQAGSSATLGTETTFVGTTMALTSISVNTGSSIGGRALARNGSMTLDSNVFTFPTCDDPPGDTTITDAGSSTTGLHSSTVAETPKPTTGGSDGP